MNTRYPRVHVALDTCFALKRWICPDDWARIFHEIGDIFCVEASTDLEIDPQFAPKSYIEKWMQSVRANEERYGLKLVSFFSGYVTYRSAGYLNPDDDYADKLLHDYAFNTIDMAREMKAAVGSTLHAFSAKNLESKEELARAEERLLDYCGRMAAYAKKQGVQYTYEQMYTPTQGWWRINDVERYMKKILQDTNSPFYLTIDTAHTVGHHVFQRPTPEQIDTMSRTKDSALCHLPQAVKSAVEKGIDTVSLADLLEEYEYLFCDPADADIYEWMRRLGCYTPIMHLQQTNGLVSAHKPFTEEQNRSGIIHPERILRALKESYDQPIDPAMPERVEDIWMPFELFFSTSDENEKIIRDVRSSVEYFRSVIRQDGKRLDEWLDGLE